METTRAIVADPGRTPPPLPSPVRAPAVSVELASALDSSSDAVLVSDRDGEVLLANAAAAELFRGSVLAGRDLNQLVPGLEEAARNRTGHPSERGLKMQAQLAAADPVPVTVRVSWIATDEGRVLAVFLRPV
ncbi:MAG TPA: PAS domain-containing protein [Actinomycetota bacterium]|nr:PAS domain-containing protein [Actinomycetota bacterium]